MRSHHKQLPTAKHTWEAHSSYTAAFGVPDRRRYRRTPPGPDRRQSRAARRQCSASPASAFLGCIPSPRQGDATCRA